MVWMAGPQSLHLLQQRLLDFTGRRMERSWQCWARRSPMTSSPVSTVTGRPSMRGRSSCWSIAAPPNGEYRWLVDQGVPRLARTAPSEATSRLPDITGIKTAQQELLESVALRSAILRIPVRTRRGPRPRRHHRASTNHGRGSRDEYGPTRSPPSGPTTSPPFHDAAAGGDAAASRPATASDPSWTALAARLAGVRDARGSEERWFDMTVEPFRRRKAASSSRTSTSRAETGRGGGGRQRESWPTRYASHLGELAAPWRTRSASRWPRS